ncbi:MAG: hypothetical protein Q4D61_01600 [Cardiobacteriaceae bacterium]|nr:hypothetical protein [Cardiobacteriaceae bacterium]
MKIPALILAVALAIGNLHAAPYQLLSMGSIMEQQGGQHSVNIGVYAQAIERLIPHAADYPTRFDNDADRAQAIKDVQFLGALADAFGENAVAQKDLALLKLNAQIYWIGHNLDQAGFAAKADTTFADWLELAEEKDKAEVMEYYGRFLASSAQGERAEPLLRSAYQAGRKESALPLAMLLLSRGDKDAALQYLREYAQSFPEDSRAQDFVEAVEKGNFEVKKAEVKPQQ